MATPVASVSAQPLRQTDLSLTGVEVTFLKPRPKTRMKHTIELDGKGLTGVIDEGSSVRWTGNTPYPPGSKISIHIRRRKCLRRWKDFASVEFSLDEDPPLPATDVKQRISVTLKFASSHSQIAQSVEANTPQLPLTAPEVEPMDDGTGFTDAVNGVQAAREKVTTKNPIVEKLGSVLRVLEVITTISEPLKDLHPAVGYAVGAISALIKLCEMQKTCREEALDLVEQFTSFVTIQDRIEVLQKRAETRRAVKHMAEIIGNASDFIRERTPTGLVGVAEDLLGSKYREKIADVKKEFGRAKDSFDRSVELEILVAVDEIGMTTESTFLHQKLSECDDAHFRSGRGCLDGTRADLLHQVMKWVDDVDETQSNIFWLHGSAGSGKSTVANTVAKMVEARGNQLSCFFCKRDDPNLSNPARLLPTLAYRFAEQYPSYRAAVMKLLRTSRGAGIAATADMKTQFERLFAELLVQTVDPLRPHVVVIDALDECGSSEDQKELVRYIMALSRATPWIKVFVTSRDEPAIHKILSQAADCTLCNINAENGVDEDIRLYIDSQVEDLEMRISDEDLRKLVGQAEGLFIWCRTLFDHLRKCLVTTRSAVLDQLLSSKGQHDSTERWSALYRLYDNILTTALGSQPDAVLFMRTILSIINVTAPNRPLSAKAIVSFVHHQGLHPRFSVEVAQEVIEKLHAVVYVDAAVHDAIRAHHTSFYDFLAWKTSTSTDSGWEIPSVTHRLVALSCLRTLHEELKFNICNIEAPALNKDVPDLSGRISMFVSDALQYSSRFWFTHLVPSTLNTKEVGSDVWGLLHSVKLLFWLECLSFQGLLRHIRFTFRVSVNLFFEQLPAIVAAAEDACRFVSFFADAMDSVPHIYLSALLWLPEDSATYKNLGLPEKTSWHLIENKRKNWDALVWESDWISTSSIAFSPDGRFVAYGTHSGDVYIRDSQTGAPEGEPFRGHQNAVRSLAYSPDGRFLASGSDDHTARIWDARTGEAIFVPLEGHSDWVRCVAFSPDGLLIASGSDDDTIRIWNAQTGKPDGGPLRHPGGVYGLAFSPDGRFIASGCDDRCVHVWCTSSRQEAVGPFQGHQDPVWTVAYSPDGRTIVSGSWDRTIRVWDAQSGEAIGDPLQGHTSHVNSVTHSPDGRFILSSSFKGTVRLWDAAARAPIGSPLQALSGIIRSVSFSPDGSLIASAGSDGVRVWDASTCFATGNQSFARSGTGSTPSTNAVVYSPDGLFIASGSDDDQIRIWNVQTGAAVNQPVLRHPGMQQGGSILSVAYSPDGRYIASGSADGDNSAVCVLDVQTGATISGPLQGHSDYIRSVAYSPDGRFVASASYDQTVHLWDVQANAASGEPLQIGSTVKSVAFSPDGRLLACGTDDGRIWLWDAATRAAIREPIKAHSGYVLSVAFSPDGRHVVSASGDHSVKIWDVHTGEVSIGPLYVHRDWIRCVAYSPDGHFIASGSEVGEVIIWDAQTGSAYRELRGPPVYIHSIAYSPDSRFLASGADNGKIYVHEVSPKHDHTEARWVAGCSRMDVQDGWVKDGDILLLWVPIPHRNEVQFCARRIIPDRAPNVGTYSIDYRTLLTRYSGKKWTDIFAGFSG